MAGGARTRVEDSKARGTRELHTGPAPRGGDMGPWLIPLEPSEAATAPCRGMISIGSGVRKTAAGLEKRTGGSICNNSGERASVMEVHMRTGICGGGILLMEMFLMQVGFLSLFEMHGGGCSWDGICLW